MASILLVCRANLNSIVENIFKRSPKDNTKLNHLNDFYDTLTVDFSSVINSSSFSMETCSITTTLNHFGEW